jgi:hypothetical protein
MTTDLRDLGDGFSWTFFVWSPDRDLNPQYKDVPDIDPAGVLIWRDGEVVAGPWFDLPAVRQRHQGPVWQVVSLDPLHLEPSIQMYDNQGAPSFHGFIRDGRWVAA